LNETRSNNQQLAMATPSFMGENDT